MSPELMPRVERPVALVPPSVKFLQRNYACAAPMRTSSDWGGAAASRNEATSGIPVSHPDDPYEREADRVAEEITGQTSARSEGFESAVDQPAAHFQRTSAEADDLRPSDDPPFVPADQTNAVTNPPAGQSLPVELRTYMEPRFGADLSDVRVHSGHGASEVTASLRAQAFTFGRHIWLGAGESVNDRRLMAHELVHVLQQAPGPISRTPGTLAREPAPATVQRARRYYMLPRLGRGERGPGSRTHLYVVGILGRATSGLLGEVRVPGAKRNEVSLTTWGVADLYKSEPKPTTIGVQFDHGEAELVPRYLPPGGELTFEGKQSGHKGPAPRGTILTGEGGKAPGITGLDDAPKRIAMGELKPAYEAETTLGRSQVRGYVTGISSVAVEVDRYARAHPDLVRPQGGRWSLQSADLLAAGDVTIPGQYRTPTRSTPQLDASLYVEDTETRVREMCVPCIRHDGSGVWTYDFVPASRLGLGRAPAPAGTKRLNTVLEGIKVTVIPPMKRGPRGKGMRKRRAAGSFIRTNARQHVQRRATDDFNFATWQRSAFQPWSKEAERLTGGTGKSALKRPGGHAEAILFEAAVAQIGARNQVAVQAAPEAAESGRELETVQHWIDHGTTYGRLRQVFGRTFIKVVDFYERARDRLQRAVRDLRGGTRGGGGSLAATVVRAIMKMVASFGKVILEKVAERLVDAVQRGAEALLKERFDGFASGVRTDVAEIQTQIQSLERMVAGALEAAVERVLKPFEAQIKIIREAAADMREISKWVDRIKWAWRVASCLAPPALGCLIGFIGSAVAEVVAAQIAASCWFQREVLFPVIRRIDFVKQLPGHIAGFTADMVRDLLPEPFRGVIGEVDKSPVEFLSSQVECTDEIKVSPDHEAIMELYSLYGEAKVDALLAALEHRGMSDNAPVTATELADVHLLLMSHTAEEIADITRTSPRVESRSSDMGQVVEDLNDGLSGGTWSGSSATGDEGSTQGAVGEAGEGQAGIGGTELSPAEQEAESRRVRERIARNKGRVRSNEVLTLLGKGKLEAGQERRAFIVERERGGKGFVGGDVTVTIRQRVPDGRWMIRLHPGARIYHEDGRFRGQLPKPLQRFLRLYTDRSRGKVAR